MKPTHHKPNARDRRVGFFSVLKRRKTEKDDAETDDRRSTTHSVRPTKPFVGLAIPDAMAETENSENEEIVVIQEEECNPDELSAFEKLLYQKKYVEFYQRTGIQPTMPELDDQNAIPQLRDKSKGHIPYSIIPNLACRGYFTK